MFKLKNKYPLRKLIQKVEWNAKAMFLCYTVLIVLAIISFFYIQYMEDYLVLYVFVFSGCIALLVLSFLLYSYSHNKQGKYSIFLIENILDELDELDEEIRISISLGDRMAISEKYFFCLKSSFYIPYAIPVDDIAVAYIKRTREYKTFLYLVTKENKHYKMPIGSKIFDKRDISTFSIQIFSSIHACAPDIILGFVSADIRFGNNAINHLEQYKV